MNDLLEKAKIDYPIGTEIKSVYKDVAYIVSKPIFIHYENIYTFDENGDQRCIYDTDLKKWAEIIKEETMTQQEFNSLRVGETLGEWEILHKYKELLIIEDKRGYDLVDLAKINKLGLKIKPKTFMGLEIKEYDNVPIEIDGNQLYYLIKVKENSILVTRQKNSTHYFTDSPTSIRIL